MKKTIGCILLLLTSTVLFAQKMDSEAIGKLPPADQELVNGYLKKSKNLKGGAIALVSVGGALMIAGMVVTLNELANDEWFDGEDPSDAGGPLILIGTAAVLGSIPCFVVSSVKKRQARAIVFAQKGVSLTPHYLIPNTSHVGLKLVIPIGK